MKQIVALKLKQYAFKREDNNKNKNSKWVKKYALRH